MGKDVEEVAASLVREYLSRKGLKKTIACMDVELPRTNLSINNRTDLRRVLHLESLYKKNKSEEHPLKSMLEMMVKERMKKGAEVKRSSLMDNRTQEIPAEENLPKSGSSFTEEDYSSERKDKDVMDQHRQRASLSEGSSAVSQLIAPSSADQTPSPKSSRSSSLVSEGERNISFSSHDGLFTSGKVGSSSERKSDDVDSQGSRTSKMRRGLMAGPITTSAQENSRRRPARKAAGSLSFLSQADSDSDRMKWTGRSWSLDAGHTESVGISSFETDSCGSVSSPRQETESDGSDGVQRVKSHKNKSAHGPRVDGLHMEGMALDDIDDEEDLGGFSAAPVHNSFPQLNLNKHPMDQQTATALKEIIFGSPVMCFSEEWKRQSFTFSNTHGLRYGIVQKKGGPCGVLAAVQATVLQKLLFERTSSDSPSERLRVSDAERTTCLAEAVAEILWRAGGRKRATVAVNSGRRLFTPVGHYRPDGVLETITCISVEGLDDLQLLLQQNIQQFESGPFGCVLLIVSAVLSRTIQMVRGDMDVPTSTLIGAHGYCTQELVNLLLCGQAVSNVFNDEMKLDSGNGNFTLLKGIRERSDVGLLSLFEHFNLCKVGSYLKTPRFPLWVVCSESHFSVLFSLCKDLTSSQWSPREFDLYYYDGLANQQEPIRLTVYPGSDVRTASTDDPDLIPPLELCISTRWTDAVVSWNESEPIL
ncbi:putative ubiquitin carboxyl-terminal hydrolase MINDY-4 [Astyanax mexicanus]|uniref:Ubiquitin carboxyl-terminal hydrolase MINDY n=1 Tax=Astyanax mexicanus TaxID=7994 RepID=A0A8T2LF97_ASTMX|nr:putative ubiquitin carboxyl-terminal hydrolase MINDY-4 [Astyanax mexicanus]